MPAIPVIKTEKIPEIPNLDMRKKIRIPLLMQIIVKIINLEMETINQIMVKKNKAIPIIGIIILMGIILMQMEIIPMQIALIRIIQLIPHNKIETILIMGIIIITTLLEMVIRMPILFLKKQRVIIKHIEEILITTINSAITGVILTQILGKAVNTTIIARLRSMILIIRIRIDTRQGATSWTSCENNFEYRPF